MALKADDSLRLTNVLLVNPVEKLRSGYWNEWAKKIAKNIICAIQRLYYMYDYSGTSDTHNLPFRKV